MLGQDTIPTTFEQLLTIESRQDGNGNGASDQKPAILFVSNPAVGRKGTIENFAVHNAPSAWTEDRIYARATQYYPRLGFKIKGKSDLGVLLMEKDRKIQMFNATLFKYGTLATNTLLVTVKQYGPF